MAAKNIAAPFIVEPSSLGNLFVRRIGGPRDRHSPSLAAEVSAASFERWRRVAGWRPASLSRVAADMNGRGNIAAASRKPGPTASDRAGDAGPPPFG